jgi:hypothetical protein
VWRCSRDGVLRSVKIGGLLRYRADDVAGLIASPSDDKGVTAT